MRLYNSLTPRPSTQPTLIQQHKFAIPAFNCTSSSTINAVLEAAKELQSPVIIQFSNGGAQYMAGKGLDNKKQEASILGAIAGAHFIRTVAPAYGIPVMGELSLFGRRKNLETRCWSRTWPDFTSPSLSSVHSDHCAKKLLPWFDGMLEADEAYFKTHGEPLFSSHMLDLSEEPKAENIEICVKYLKRMAAMDCLLEMEIGITGGEEDGVNNESVDNASLYTQPQDILDIYEAFTPVRDLISTFETKNFI